tara:strand:+ start:1285 stop:1950 length:666 start_codon:yes stop_codon:yes gene_type:complete
MKKITGLLLVVFILSSVGLKAQHDVRVSALGLIFKSYGLGYEYVINDEIGAGINLNKSNSFGFGIGDNGGSNSSFSSFRVAPEVRFYFNPEDGADGFYFGAYLKYAKVTWSNIEVDQGGSNVQDPITGQYEYISNPTIQYDLNFSGMAFGIQSGKKWVTNSGFFLETNFNFGRYLSGSAEYSTPEAKLLYEEDSSSAEDAMNIWYTFDFGFALNIGWRFGQ